MSYVKEKNESKNHFILCMCFTWLIKLKSFSDLMMLLSKTRRLLLIFILKPQLGPGVGFIIRTWIVLKTFNIAVQQNPNLCSVEMRIVSFTGLCFHPSWGHIWWTEAAGRGPNQRCHHISSSKTSITCMVQHVNNKEPQDITGDFWDSTLHNRDSLSGKVLVTISLRRYVVFRGGFEQTK